MKGTAIALSKKNLALIARSNLYYNCIPYMLTDMHSMKYLPIFHTVYFMLYHVLCIEIT